MRFFHYSTRKILRMRSRRHQEETRPYKPDGLWVSYYDDWASWVTSETSWKLGKYVYEVVLNPDAKLLYMSTLAELEAFDKKYGFPLLPQFPLGRIRSIEWSRVTQEYDGIIIAPYVYPARHTFHWYYGWDVGSGCLWHRNAVTELIQTTHAAVPSVERHLQLNDLTG